VKQNPSIRVRRAGEDGWELVHPRCAKARAEDIEEVQKMIAAGETDVARDELRWLLDECHDFIEAHALLGDLALAENDFKLARGHYGYAYQLGLRAIERTKDAIHLSASNPANRPLFQAGKCLVQCLLKMGKRGLAQDVVKRLAQLDPNDPLGLRSMLSRSR
jgi:tetratricopeptide (TPR) repeat protein